MATVSINYADGSTFTQVTCTLTSLGNGLWRESDLVNNTSNLYVDCLCGGIITTGGTAPTDKSSIDIFVYGQWDATGDYTGGLTGADAAWTADGSEYLFRRLATIIVDTTINQGYEWGPVALAPSFGGVIPPRWGFVIQNNTGQALNSTGTNHELRYQGIKYTVA